MSSITTERTIPTTNTNINDNGYIQVFVRTLNNETLAINISSSATVNELKDFISHAHSIPIEMQQLFHQGRLLKNNRKLSYYKINDETTMNHPLLLTQMCNIDVFISKKVLSLYSLTDNKSSKTSKSDLPKQNSVECSPNTTVNSILKQLNLDHLSHLLKVCVGAGTDDIRDFDKKIVDIPGLLQDGILSVLFSARWFIERTEDITHFSHLMSETITKSTASAKELKSCLTFAKLDHQFEKTQAFILEKFEEIDTKMTKQTKEINRAWKWVKNLSSSVDEMKADDDAHKLLTQLQNKVENIDRTLKIVKRKWIKKRKQIILYLQKSVRETETELMKHFRSWLASDIVQWVQYMDDRIIFDGDIISKFVTANINGYNLSDVNDLSLKLMGIGSIEIRQLIIGYIDTLLTKYGQDNKGSHSPYCHSPYCNSSGCDSPGSSENGNNNNLCCICATNDVTTVIVPCGHATYCSDCSHESIKHSNQCPICRSPVQSIITVYKAGLQFAEN